jgi:hypothetical protein
MEKIKKLQDQLFKTRNNYIHLDRCLGMREGNVPYEQWNIYTPDISHNSFENKEEFIEFLERLVSDDAFYNGRSIEKLREDLESAKNRLVDDQKTLERLTKNLEEAEKAEKGQ